MDAGPCGLKLKRLHIEQIITQAREGLPDEVCGLLAGRGETVEQVIPVTNSAPSPTSYHMAPEGQFEAIRNMRESGLRQIGIYHSHPVSPPFPSGRDVELAFYTDCVYVIVGLAAGEPEIRAYRISETGEVREVSVRTDDGGGGAPPDVCESPKIF